MEPKTLSAEVRHKGGKGPARQLRMRGLIPAAYYGPDVEPKKLTVSPEQLRVLLEGPYGRNQLIELDIEGDKTIAMVKDLDVHPVTRRIRHADFFAVGEGRMIKASVPFETKGRALGVQRGGVLRKLFRELPVRALPQDVPAEISFNVAPLEMGAEIEIADLPLPEGVEIMMSPERRAIMVEAKSLKQEAIEAEEAEAEAETPAAATPPA